MSEMINELVEKYVAEKNIKAVRSALTGLGYIGDKDSYVTFQKSTEYANEKLEGLFQDDDGSELPKIISLASYKEIISLMMENFSKLKFNEALHIGSELFENREQEAQRSSMNENTKESGKEENPFLKVISKHPIGAIIVLLLVALLVRQIVKSF